ncbi:putative pectinacetylesterase/NOTUM [Helianthus annuus]|uniref:Pectin acetylesterase n=1 Tax=Helianthus annuus TaxID=4232 RepID=A0A251RQR2_HELAN|nr:pectin acetylesterase 8 [Helianthus annuus]KAF5753747.1 putative pectinacetylesterase/NOTUM [Helianthus annuus]
MHSCIYSTHMHSSLIIQRQFLCVFLYMMIQVRSNLWLSHTLVCVLIIFLKVEGTSEVAITIIEGAVAKGAVCLDGSPPAYQFDAGFGDGVNNWLVHIQGGGWCNSVNDCRMRTYSQYGSSKKMKSSDYNFTGILSNKQELNPSFYNWNRVAMRYCDGSSLTGDIEAVDPATNLHFRGARVFKVIIEELVGKGMKSASNALLSGSSAGGLASILHCDKFKAIFPTNTRVKCFSDAGYFAHVKDLSGEYKFEGYYDQVVALHGSSKNLYPECTSKMKPSLCFYPQFAMPYVQTPVFILHSTYDTFQVQNILATPQADPSGLFTKCKQDINTCSTDQIQKLQDFRSEFLEAFLVAQNGSSRRGWFVNNCFTHGQCEYQRKWLGSLSSKLNHKAIAEVVGDWFYERNYAVQLIDDQNVLPHYCID